MTNGRKAFIETLTELATKDPRVILIIGDVGFRFIEPFREKFPNQFINVGAAEQTMMGFAAGMSRVGWKPYVYTMINFIVFRPYEQVRNDLAYGNADVHLFGVQGSEAYKFLGHSHNIETTKTRATCHQCHTPLEIHQDEDQRLMSHLPNMKAYFPTTEQQVRDFMLAEYERSGPSYIRI